MKKLLGKWWCKASPGRQYGSLAIVLGPADIGLSLHKVFLLYRHPAPFLSLKGSEERSEGAPAIIWAPQVNGTSAREQICGGGVLDVYWATTASRRPQKGLIIDSLSKLPRRILHLLIQCKRTSWILGCGLMSEHFHRPAEKNWKEPQKLHFSIKASVVSKAV